MGEREGAGISFFVIVILERTSPRGRSGIQRKKCRRHRVITSSTSLALYPWPIARPCLLCNGKRSNLPGLTQMRNVMINRGHLTLGREMAEKLQSLHVKRFKGIVDALFDVANINVFIGANNSGKSTIA